MKNWLKCTLYPLAVGLLAVASGAAMADAKLPMIGVEGAPHPKVSEVQPTDPEAVALKSRVMGRWELLLARDYDKAYADYVSPTYRAAFTQKHFYRGYGELVRRDKVDVVRIAFNGEKKEAATVVVNIYVTTEVGGKAMQLDSPMKEGWAKIDGEWYLVPK